MEYRIGDKAMKLRRIMTPGTPVTEADVPGSDSAARKATLKRLVKAGSIVGEKDFLAAQNAAKEIKSPRREGRPAESEAPREEVPADE